MAVIQQRVEVEQQLRDASERAQAELAALERETARLREAKKQDDGSKSRLRQSSKAVEEAKTRAELAKVRCANAYVWAPWHTSPDRLSF